MSSLLIGVAQHDESVFYSQGGKSAAFPPMSDAGWWIRARALSALPKDQR
ncbi:MAG: hypothetical protein ACOY3V_02525 [Pseudomonadota bacterium]